MRVRVTPMMPALGAVVWMLGVQSPTGLAHAQTSSTTGEDAAAAQTMAGTQQLQEVLVTAERRETDVQKTADSISVRTGAQLQDQGKFSLPQILEDVPGVMAVSPVVGTGGSGSGTDSPSSGLTIRGIQSNAGAGTSVTSAAAAAAIYVDGVYEGVGANYDIDRVEVLRGPQGTLYGRSATSGLVAIHTADPNLTRFGGNASAEFGNYALQHYTAALNAPIVDNVLGLRVSGNYYAHNGYYGNPENGLIATTDGRVKLLFKPNDDFSLLLGAASEHNLTHSPVTIATYPPASSPPTISSPPIGSGSNDFRQYWALFNWNLGFGTLTYQPALRGWDSHTSSFLRTVAIGFNNLVNVRWDNFNTQELRLASNPGSKLIWQLGTTFYMNDLSSNASTAVLFPPNPVPVPFLGFTENTVEKTTHDLGMFAEATYPFAPSWRFTGGLRYDYSKVAIDQSYAVGDPPGAPLPLAGSAGVRRYYNFTYKARLEHDLTEQNLLYASISTGFSPGDISITTDANNAPVVLDLKAETLTAYEIGSKNRFLDNSLQVNGAVYYYYYGAYQNAAVSVAPPQNPGAFTTLASPAEIFGGELETIEQLTPHDRVGLDLSYTNAYYVSKWRTQVLPGRYFGNYFQLNSIPGVVPFTANVNYDHVIPLVGGSTLTLHGDFRYLSPVDSIALGDAYIPQGAYAYGRVSDQLVGDLSFTWASSNDRYSVTGYVRNVGDNEYKQPQVVQDNRLGTQIGNVPTNLYDPRTYGVILSARF